MNTPSTSTSTVGRILFLFTWCLPVVAVGQVRYLDEVFPGVEVETGIPYAVNASVLFFSFFQEAIPDSLSMDIYTPEGDLETDRPLVIYLHDGHFLPYINPADPSEFGFNGMCMGERSDSLAVEICSRLARMGYVVASIDYRLGWNPLASSSEKRAFGLVNAVYRGVQDARTAIRFFRRSVVEEGNLYGIDPDRIVLWGAGSGGMVTLNATMLDVYGKIPTGTGGKFLWDDDGDPLTPKVPMVLEEVNGDPDGVISGIDPATGDTFCYPNHVGFASDFALEVNLGGACLDSAWMESGQVPLISLAVPGEIETPYGDGIYMIPHLEVLGVHGSYAIHKMAQALGNQQVFLDFPKAFDLSEEQGDAFDQSPAGYQTPVIGVYPFNTQEFFPGDPQPVPWAWASGPNMDPIWNSCTTDKAIAIAYIDTIMRIFSPRACLALGLTACIDELSKLTDAPTVERGILTYPNPGSDVIRVRTATNEQIRSLDILDSWGRSMDRMDEVGSSETTVDCRAWSPGIYLVSVRLASGETITRTIIH